MLMTMDQMAMDQTAMEQTVDAAADMKTMETESALLAPVPDYATPGRAGWKGTSGSPDHVMPELCVEKPWYRRSWLAIGLVVVALYSIVVFQFWGAADSGVDQNAYLVGGRLIAEHFSMKYVLPNPYAYTGGMMVRTTPPTVPDLTPGPDGKPVLDAVKVNTDSVYYPKYPFGLPLLYAGFFWVFKVASVIPILKHHVHPEQAAYWAFLVSPISSVLSIAGMFFLARQVAGSFAAALAAILLGTSQLMMMLMDNPNSHASCLAFVVWGMYFCVRWMKCGTNMQYVYGILAGLLVGYAGTIRDSEKTLFIAMCVLVLSRLPWNHWKSYLSTSIAIAVVLAAYLIYAQVQNSQAAIAGTEAKWTPSQIHLQVAGYVSLILFSLGGLTIGILFYSLRDWLMYARAIVPGLAWAVPVGILMLVNLKTMGHLTGYDTTHESEFGDAFLWKYFWQNWEKAIRVFYDMGLFFVLPFAVAGLVMLFRKSWRLGLLMVAWLVPGVMLYMSYYWSPDFADAYARFFLAYMPALLIGVAVCFHDGILAGKKAVSSFDNTSAKLATGIMLAWLLPGVCYCTIHYLGTGHPLRWADPSLVFLVYMPAVVACIALGVHEVPLMLNRDRGQYGNVTLTLAAGMVVMVAAGISSWRTIHGLRDGSQQTKMPINDFRDRESLAQTGQMLLANVPAKSVLFAENAGGISTPINYIQFLRDWELYGADAFTQQESRRGFGAPAGNGRGNRNNMNGRGGGGGRNNGPGGPGGGRFAGGPPGGGGMGGPGMGGPGMGNGNGNGNGNADTTQVAAPVQPDQQEYHRMLYEKYRDNPKKLYKLEAEVVDKAFGEKRRVFLAVAKEHPAAATNTNSIWGTTYIADPLVNFKEDLNSAGHYKYKVITHWTDVALPDDKDDDFEPTDNNPMGGGRGGGFGRMLMANDRIMDWQLIEILPLPTKDDVQSWFSPVAVGDPVQKAEQIMSKNDMKVYRPSPANGEVPVLIGETEGRDHVIHAKVKTDGHGRITEVAFE